ncbi:MAG: polysaccharide biosynthesis/export family protein [Acidobacteria bacterium]|nr:polysaccharide biosynthesis/export family protein [Acidobacteriota bacterium]MCW5949538.1 polysaccharide biosynthesis/export family protein [Pyrinomonadaceae bacterium]
MISAIRYLELAFCIAITFAFAASVPGQAPALKQKPRSGSGSAPKATPKAAPTPPDGDTDAAPTGELSPEEAAILPYYSNYLKEYRIGPSDIISVEVFGQCPDYCKMGITVPPNARISYPLIREGVFVAGKTVEQIADEITKKLDEYIIDPKVTVSLDKAMSTRYSVMGKVASPGVRVMDRKVSVYEAIIDAGGVAKGGDRKKAYIISYNKQGKLEKRIVSLADMESGKAEMVFLNPGDQVFVPGKGFSVESVFDILGKASVVRFLFGSPF